MAARGKPERCAAGGSCREPNAAPIWFDVSN
jgi:hypothetical protein